MPTWVKVERTSNADLKSRTEKTVWTLAEMVVPRIGRVIGKKSRNILFAVSKADDQVEVIVEGEEGRREGRGGEGRDVDVLVQRFQDDAALVEEAGC